MNTYPIESVEWLVVHGSATAAITDIGRVELRRLHMLQGDYDIGYHYVVRRDGTIEHCRPTDVVGNHAEGYNLHSIGICIIGGRAGKTTRSENNYTDRQLESLRILLVSLQSEHDAAEVLGHDQLPGVRHTCPGFDVRDWYNKGIN